MSAMALQRRNFYLVGDRQHVGSMLLTVQLNVEDGRLNVRKRCLLTQGDASIEDEFVWNVGSRACFKVL